MGYIIGQYNHNRGPASENEFITLINGTAKQKETQSNIEVFGDSMSFLNECLQAESNFNSNNYYYFRCFIKKSMDLNSQRFTIKLIKYNADTEQENMEQYIKSITVEPGNGWVSMECIFNPVIDEFDTILFQLQRVAEDYSGNPRTAVIGYQELGIIRNIIPSKIEEVNLLKLGVQSRPGLQMCINGEEIHTSRSGIYEIRNGVIPVTFFSVVSAAEENTSDLDDWKAGNPQASQSFTNTSKTINIDAFILDYMYEKE